jgi:Tol biopolymer transport system component
MRPTLATLAFVLVIAHPSAAFFADADFQRLVMQSLDGKFVLSIPIVGDSNHVPMWSPDGKWLAFQVLQKDQLELATVQSNGGAPHVFHDAVSASNQSFKWSPDSQSIGFLDPQRHQFRVLTIETGAVRTIVVDSKAQIGSWVWRPDGRSIAAVMTTPGASPGLRFLRRRVDEITLDGKQREVLDSELVRSAPGIVFVDPYTIFVRNDTAAYRVALESGDVRQLVGDLANSVLPSTGAHATAQSSEVWAGLIKRAGSEVGQIEFISARTGERRIVDVPFRFPLGASPEWMPNGSGLVVIGQSPGEKALKIYLVPVVGGEPSAIATIGDGTDGWTSVSPDGNLIVYGAMGYR